MFPRSVGIISMWRTGPLTRVLVDLRLDVKGIPAHWISQPKKVV